MKKYIGNIIPWLIIVSSVGLIIYNVMYNEKFLETSLVSILSLVTVILVSFYLVQMKNEKK